MFLRAKWIRVCLVSMLILIGASDAHGQRGWNLGWLQGHIVDATSNEPIPFVRMEILVNDSIWDTITDYEGFYLIRLPFGKASVNVHKEAYITFHSELIIAEDRIVFKDISLEAVKKQP